MPCYESEHELEEEQCVEHYDLFAASGSSTDALLPQRTSAMCHARTTNVHAVLPKGTNASVQDDFKACTFLPKGTSASATNDKNVTGRVARPTTAQDSDNARWRPSLTAARSRSEDWKPKVPSLAI